MQSSMPKINLGRDAKPMSYFNLDHDVSTTSDFGFVQPLFCWEMIANSTLTMQLSQMIRVAPLDQPTFSRIKAKCYHRFVPTAEVMPAFENLVSGQPYYTADSNYIPTSVPVAYLSDIATYILYNYLEEKDIKMFRKNESNVWSLLAGSGTRGSLQTGGNLTFSDGSTVTRTGSISYTLDITDVTPSSADYLVRYSYNAVDFLQCFKFNDIQRRLYKILIGLGYQMNPNTKLKVSILPLLAYYKAYYDLFSPQRSNTWTSTACYKLIDFIRVNGIVDVFSNATSKTLFFNFIDELKDTFYTIPQDYVSSHIASPAISKTPTTISVSNGTSLGMTDNAATAAINEQPMHVLASGEALTKNKLDALYRLTRDVNKNTVLGGRIADYLRVHGFGESMVSTFSNHIGASVTPIDIDDIMSTASTEGAILGEYGGRGIGAKAQQSYKFSAKMQGYWITLFAIVPEAGYCQQLSPMLLHRSRYEQYDGQFDALGFELTNKACVFGQSDVTLAPPSEPIAFGFIPRYSNFKTIGNKINGNLSMRGTRGAYLGYTLDRFITPDNVVVTDVVNPSQYKLRFDSTNIPQASEQYRYIGKEEWTGNFNRIFSDVNDAQNKDFDNFIVHNVLNIKYYAPMLPLADSFDTDEKNKSTLEVEHS